MDEGHRGGYNGGNEAGHHLALAARFSVIRRQRREPCTHKMAF